MSDFETQFSQAALAKRYRPQFSITEMEALLAGLHTALATQVSPDSDKESIPETILATPDGLEVPRDLVVAVTNKLYIFKQKVELGLTVSSYIAAGTKPGRKSAADILLEESTQRAEEKVKQTKESKLSEQYNPMQTAYNLCERLGWDKDRILGESSLETYAKGCYVKMGNKESLTEEEKELANKYAMVASGFIKSL